MEIIIISDTHHFKCQNKNIPLKSHIQARETTINIHRPSSEELHTLLLILPFYTVTLSFCIDIFLIQHFKNYTHNILFPRLFFPCYVYPHKSINCEVSVPCKPCIHILLFLSSTWLWHFRPKAVVESNRINSCVLTGFIVIIILLSYTGMKFVLSAWQSRNMLKRFEKRLLKAILLGKHE